MNYEGIKKREFDIVMGFIASEMPWVERARYALTKSGGRRITAKVRGRRKHLRAEGEDMESALYALLDENNKLVGAAP